MNKTFAMAAIALLLLSFAACAIEANHVESVTFRQHPKIKPDRNHRLKTVLQHVQTAVEGESCNFPHQSSFGFKGCSSGLAFGAFLTEDDNKEEWRSDAIAYIDKIILESKGKSDLVSTEYNEFVIIQSPKTLEKLKQYIRNSKSISDMTGIKRKPSEPPHYQVGEMPWMNYEGFDFKYENPYQIISFRFTETDRKEFHEYLNRVIWQSSPFRLSLDKTASTAMFVAFPISR